MAQKHLSQLLLPAAGIRSAAFTAHSCPAHGSSLRGGEEIPAARSIRSWFRPTGGFRHPSFGLFSLRRLTSPSVEAPSFIAPLRPAGSRPFRAGYPRCRGPVSAITAEPSLSPASSTPSAISFLAVGIPSPCSDGTSGAYPVVQCGEADGGLRPIVRRVLVPPSSRVPIDDPTRMPFWLRPVSTFGRFSITDLDNGRSLAFSLPSSAGPPPEWCSQIMAVVPRASYGGLLLRMSR